MLWVLKRTISTRQNNINLIGKKILTIFSQKFCLSRHVLPRTLNYPDCSVCFYPQFFVAADPTVKNDRLWHDKYSLRKSMIPTFISTDQARKVGF